MIDYPSDTGRLTPLGRLAGEMPVDMQLSRLIAFGVQLGVGVEACIMAAALSMPKSPFRQASPFVHRDPYEYNSILIQTLVSAIKLDADCYSEPIMYLRMVIIWLKVRT
jgi:HrpA-like RNA helicase